MYPSQIYLTVSFIERSLGGGLSIKSKNSRWNVLFFWASFLSDPACPHRVHIVLKTIWHAWAYLHLWYKKFKSFCLLFKDNIMLNIVQCSIACITNYVAQTWRCPQKKYGKKSTLPALVIPAISLTEFHWSGWTSAFHILARINMIFL